MEYETNRENFEKIIKNYLSYVDLYKTVNGGSSEGIVPFDEFYWLHNYHVKYEDPSRIATVRN